MTTQLLDDRLQSDLAASILDADTLSESNPAAPAVEIMERYARLTGLAFMCVDAHQGCVLAKTDPDLLEIFPRELLKKLPRITETCFFEIPAGILFYMIPLPEAGGLSTVALGYVLSNSEARPADLVLAATEKNWSASRIKRWIARQSHCPVEFLDNLVSLAVRQVAAESRERSLEQEIELLSDEIGASFEEINLLHSLTHDLHLSRRPAELAESCLTRMHLQIEAEGNVIWFEEESETGKSHSLIRGRIPFDELGMARLISLLDNHDWSQPFVSNEIDDTPLCGEFPGLRSLIVVPIGEDETRSGWILSVNKRKDRFFGTVEAGLLQSIATILGTHLRNLELYRQHRDLLLSFVRSLVSTLDAKDHYTRGHSERVALIACRLGEELGLPEDDLQDLYLAGLLHDVGKIGVDDSILRKPGVLSAEEFQKIQDHPVIGWEILKGLDNLQRILPGVRNHHEAYSGKGYPDGLKGESIPLQARILAVADSYDAMGSNRPYRDGMPLEKVEEIFRRGAGEQWDEKVIEAYFSARHDIRRICDDYSLSGGNLLDSQHERFLASRSR